MSRAVLIFALIVGLSACDDDEMNKSIDLPAVLDLAMPDLPITLPDLSGCTPPQFPGFAGASAVERRFDCTACGCTIDPLVAPSGLWTQTLMSATLTGNPQGIEITADGSSGTAFGALASTNPVAEFYLDGDFDLLLDYEVLNAVPGGKINLRMDMNTGVFWEVARARTVAGEDVFSSLLGGTPPTSATAAAQGSSGTLRLTRVGFTVTAYGNGIDVAKNLSGGAARAAVFVSVGVLGCPSPDGGVTDGGNDCTERARVRNLRLASGVLVDRR